jgi:hypothetical protein
LPFFVVFFERAEPREAFVFFLFLAGRFAARFAGFALVLALARFAALAGFAGLALAGAAFFFFAFFAAGLFAAGFAAAGFFIAGFAAMGVATTGFATAGFFAAGFRAAAFSGAGAAGAAGAAGIVAAGSAGASGAGVASGVSMRGALPPTFTSSITRSPCGLAGCAALAWFARPVAHRCGCADDTHKHEMPQGMHQA